MWHGEWKKDELSYVDVSNSSIEFPHNGDRETYKKIWDKDWRLFIEYRKFDIPLSLKWKVLRGPIDKQVKREVEQNIIAYINWTYSTSSFFFKCILTRQDRYMESLRKQCSSNKYSHFYRSCECQNEWVWIWIPWYLIKSGVHWRKNPLRQQDLETLPEACIIFEKWWRSEKFKAWKMLSEINKKNLKMQIGSSHLSKNVYTGSSNQAIKCTCAQKETGIWFEEKCL